ncbi:MAG TPA: hypothetical protein VFK80_03400 [Limnochordia bacterium]|nr:hypothetical protein [Limnochordia bacterium]
MWQVIVAGIIAAVAFWWLMPSLGEAGRAHALKAENHRGQTLPLVGGIAVGAAALLGLGFGTLLSAWSSGLAVLYSLAVLGFGWLGIVDDALGDGGARGLKGHVAELARGRVTTGLLKALLGLVLGFLVSQAIAWPGAGWPARTAWLIVYAGVIALGANLFNLLDLRPGRALKLYFAVVFALLAATLVWRTRAVELGPLVVISAAAAAYLPVDLRAEAMLGDAGANMLGGVLGLALVLVLPAWGALVAFAILAALTLLSERFSFGRLIEGTPLLARFDAWGRSVDGGDEPGQR